MARREELSDEQWKIIEPLPGEMPRRSDGGGRPWRDNREVINGILWILRTGAPWADLPPVSVVPNLPSTFPDLG